MVIPLSPQKSAEEESVISGRPGEGVLVSQGQRALVDDRWREKIAVDFAGIFVPSSRRCHSTGERRVQYRDFLSPGKIYAYMVLSIRCQDPPGMKQTLL